MLELNELKSLHDKAYESGIITREKSADDLVFYWITQWQDNALEGSNLQYRGEFNILRKAGRQISQDLKANPVQVDFDPVAGGRDDGADLLDGLYRTDDRINSTIESYNNAAGETIVCGVGAWELYTDYKSNRAGQEHQVIKRRPVYEANNNCFWDAAAKSQDKSDANYVSILTGYSETGYLDLLEELTGERPDKVNRASFKHPEHSFTFPWIGSQNDLVYVASFYHRELIEDKVLTLEDPVGQEIMLRASDVEEVMDDLIDEGYFITDERKIKRFQVTKYIASGAEILDSFPIAGENLPVVPVYGERAFVEGEEHYEGVTRLAKDPQTLRNFQMSYLADILSRSPRNKPVVTPEMVQSFEFMYEENGADNNYPYYLMNSIDVNGTPLIPPPMMELPEQKVPQSLIYGMQETRNAVSDVANAGAPAEISDVDLSGKAVIALQNRLDQQSIVYQENMKHAKRRDGEIYASMAADVYDAPREVTLTLPDGSRKKEKVMSHTIDKETGEMVYLNDLTNIEFEVYADIGASYATQKEETMDVLDKMVERLFQVDPPMAKMLMLKQMQLIDGVDMTDIRDYARRQSIVMGFAEPETDEEVAMLQQAQQAGSQPDPAELLAQAEQAKGDAMKMREARSAQADQNKHMIDQGKLLIEGFRAKTDRANMRVKEFEAGANLDMRQIQGNFDMHLKAAQMRNTLQPQPQMTQ